MVRVVAGTLSGLVLLASSGSAQLGICFEESGRISLSVDGEGNLDELGGLLEFDKPAGATVRAAYLAAASNFARLIMDGDIRLNGVPVAWDKEAFNDTDLTVDFFHNVIADVTDLVQGTIDAAPAGPGTIPVVEFVDTATIDGVIFAVVFDDPNVRIRDERTIQVYFGAQDPFGDAFSIALGEPLNLSLPRRKLELGLGISFGFQPFVGGEQASEVLVNGEKLTRSAGGPDDGIGEPAMGGGNGALITVGGIGDSPENPADPCADPDGFRSDDELYDLLPYYQPGSTMLTVETSNASLDDNIFWATVCVTNESGVTETITLAPTNATLVLGADHTVTATVMDSEGNAVVGRTVDFEVLSGPNAGDAGSSDTDGMGMASFTYTGDGGPGEDRIQASFLDSQKVIQVSNIAKATWQEQCLLVVGSGSGSGSFTPADHTFQTQVGDVDEYSPVLLNSLAEWEIPLPEKPASSAGHGKLRRFGGPRPELITSFTVQVLMWNPIDFPNNPEQYSHGLRVQVWSNGQVTGLPYGTLDSIRVWVESEIVEGGPGEESAVRVRFPFQIAGL